MRNAHWESAHGKGGKVLPSQKSPRQQRCCDNFGTAEQVKSLGKEENTVVCIQICKKSLLRHGGGMTTHIDVRLPPFI